MAELAPELVGATHLWRERRSSLLVGCAPAASFGSETSDQERSRSMTAIKSMLRATILTGAIAFLPNLAAADTSQPSNAQPTEGMPDHAQAEAGSMPTETTTPRVPDHAQAEARAGQDEQTASTTKGIPDHAEAEARSAGWQ